MRNSVKVVIGAVLAGTGGLLIWWQTQPVPVVEPTAESVVESAAEPAAEPATEPATETAVAKAPNLASSRVRAPQL